MNTKTLCRVERRPWLCSRSCEYLVLVGMVVAVVVVVLSEQHSGPLLADEGLCTNVQYGSKEEHFYTVSYTVSDVQSCSFWVRR